MIASDSPSIVLQNAPAEAFDAIASDYDQVFSRSAIGRAQRAQVARQLGRRFLPGCHVLELNCGTGEDALALARGGVEVSAYDASPEMVRIANRKLIDERLPAKVQFSVLRNELLFQLEGSFDGAFSNFAGLNCSLDWSGVARELARLVKPGGHLLLCVMGRRCIWEIVHFFLRGRFRKAFRRVRRSPAIARIGGSSLKIVYPSVREIRQLFSPGFRLCGWRGVGVFVPPSYCEPHVVGKERTLNLLANYDAWFAHLPGIRGWGDHVLLDFVRRPA